MLIKRVCEVYHKTPADLEDLTYDQLMVLAMDDKTLKRIGGGLATGLMGEAQQDGIDFSEERKELGKHLSLAQKLQAEEGSEEKASAKRARRAKLLGLVE